MFQFTGSVFPVNENLPGVTNDETRHSHLRSVYSRRRRRCRCYYTQDRSRPPQSSVGFREYAASAMRSPPAGRLHRKSDARQLASSIRAWQEYIGGDLRFLLSISAFSVIL
jgi:hypothetical protein